MSVQLRPATIEDAEPCGRILSDAFTELHVRHGFPVDFPDHDSAIRFIRGPIGSETTYGVVAEIDGRIVGSNFLDERDEVRSVGPVSVHPIAQGRGVGRRLMEDVIARSRGATSVRLVQEAFNALSLPLYASLGFDPIEPLFLINGRPKNRPMKGVEVRPAVSDDLPECEELCRKLHGVSRIGELSEAMRRLTPYVAVRERRIVAYCTTMNVWGPAHGIAETDHDMRALILGFAAGEERPVQFLMPVRQGGFFRWCLTEGFRVVKPLTLMVRGDYNPPHGCWFPSAMY